MRNIIPHKRLGDERVNEDVLKVQRWFSAVATEIENAIKPYHPRAGKSPLAYLQHLASLLQRRTERKCVEMLSSAWRDVFGTQPPASFTADDLFLLGRALAYRNNPDATQLEEESEAAINEIMSGFYPLALQVASAYLHKVTHVPLEDLQAEAVSGIIVAINYFDPSAGRKFSTYLVPTLCSYLRDAIGRLFHGFRIPASSWRLHMKARSEGSPSPIPFTVSLEAEAAESEEEGMVDVLIRPAAEIDWEDRARKMEIDSAVERLPMPLRSVILMHFWEGETTVKEMAQRLAMEPSIVRALLQLALAVLRYYLK